jgi:hypothetical protein
MSRTLARFLTTNRLGRRITTLIHGSLLHPGWNHPMRFAQYGCWLCRQVTAEYIRDDPYRDQSNIKVSEPEYAPDGALVRRGMSISATAQRQLDEIMANADPKQIAALHEAMDRIAKDPE